MANWGESLLGASLQGRSGMDWLTNDVVNMLQICAAAALGIAIYAAALLAL